MKPDPAMYDIKPTSNATASSSKLEPKPRKSSRPSLSSQQDVKPLISVKAELVIDDFDQVVQQDAKSYSADKKWDKDRANVKSQNKALKAAGKKLLKPPTKPTSFLLKSSDDDQDSNDEGTKSSYRRRGNNRSTASRLPMEGLVIYPGSPLHKLAGLPEPAGESETKTDPWSLDYDSKSKSKSAQAGAKTMINGVLVKKPKVEPKSPAMSDEAILAMLNGRNGKSSEGASEDSDDAYMDYDDDDDEDFMIAPAVKIQAAPVSIAKTEPGLIKTDKKPAIKVETTQTEDDDDDYDYGDEDEDEDVIIRPTVQSSQSQLEYTETGPIEPGCKPAFPITVNQAMIGPLQLDPNDASTAVPASINRFLRPYQQEGVKFFWKQYSQGKGGILGDDMGLGKTIQVISFLSAIMKKTGTIADQDRRKKIFRRDGPLEPLRWPTALIIVPASLSGNWARELDTWGYFEYALFSGPDKDALIRGFNRGQYDIIITSYETLRDNVTFVKDLPWSTVIFDEAHRLKNPTAALTLAAKKVHCLRAFGLTGTLIQNRLEEMWSVLDFAARGQVGTRRQWTDFIVRPIKLGHRLDTTIGPMVDSIMRLYQLKNKILPEFYLRRDKRLIAHELPTKRDVAIFCPLASDQVIAYKAILESKDCKFVLNRNLPCECASGKSRIDCCHESTEDGRSLQEVIFPIMHGLSKTANHVALLLPSQDVKTKISRADREQLEMCHQAGLPIRSQTSLEAGWNASYCGKWKILQSLLQDWRKEPVKNKSISQKLRWLTSVLIFSNSVRLLRIVHDFIQMKLHYNCLLLIGEIPPSERLPMVDDFQNPDLDNYIFLISTMAGGVGLNLTAANKVVILDPNWNPANDLQAMDRAFRIGQKRPVDVYRMIGEGTIEEIMYERQVHKQIRSKQINDGTFEARVHVGYDGAKGKEAQGELFGIQNLFIYKEGGFMRGNLNRVKEAEDYFMAEATGVFEPDTAEDDELEGADEDEQDTIRANRRMADSLKKEKAVVDELLEEEQGSQHIKEEKPVNDEVLSKLKFIASAHNHDSAFGDSAAERGIFEAGLEVLRSNPGLANKLKAFEIGSYVKQQTSKSLSSKKREESRDLGPIKRPAKGDVKRKRRLVDLSDEE